MNAKWEQQRRERLAQDFVKAFGSDPPRRRRDLFDVFCQMRRLRGRERVAVADRVASLIDGRVVNG